MKFSEVFNILSQNPTSNTVAAAGSMAWFWVPYVQSLSSAAGTILPIISVLWLGIQIYSHLRGKKK